MSWRRANATDEVHVWLATLLREQIDDFAHDGIHPYPDEVVSRPVGDLRYRIEDCGIHRSVGGIGWKRLCNVERLTEKQTTRGVALCAIRASRDRNGVGEVHALTLRSVDPRATPDRGSPWLNVRQD